MAEGDAPVPSYVRVPIDSTGKYMRNVQITVMQPDGTTPDTQMEVVCVADDQGNIVSFAGLQDVLTQQLKTNELLEQILDALTSAAPARSAQAGLGVGTVLGVSIVAAVFYVISLLRDPTAPQPKRRKPKRKRPRRQKR